MRAVVQDRYGTSEQLRIEEIEKPPIEPDEALVRVYAAGVDRGTWHLMTGRPYLLRLALGLRGPRARVPGLDLAGVVTAVGSQVTRCAAGDRVLGICRGSFAEFAAVKQDKLALMPEGMAYEEAAAVPVSGLTAIQALQDVGRLTAGQRVLILGASGGVGSFAVQIAVAMGAEVTGVARTSKLDFVRSLGAGTVVDHCTEDIAAAGSRFDLILDIGGNTPVRRLRRILTRTGTLVVVGNETDGRWTGGIGRSVRAAARSPFVKQRLVMLVAKEHYDGIERLVELIRSGHLRPAVDSTYPLEQAGAAIDHLASGTVRGKVVLSMPSGG